MDNLETLLKETLHQHLSHRNGKTPSHLAEAMRYSLLSAGKRIRPRILFASAQTLGLSAEKVAPAALALEIAHCFTLIHDDLPCMDNDDFRRGMPSNHKKFGEATALLAGDALLALASEVFLETQAPPALLISSLRRFLDSIGPRGVIGGQAAEALLSKDSTLADLEQMHRQKTGALFSAAVLVPKDLAGISDDSREGQALIQFADQLGLSFQIADDLEDGTQGLHQPTSILFFRTPTEAGRETLERLTESSRSIQLIWGEAASPLIGVANEVISKIKTALEGYRP